MVWCSRLPTLECGDLLIDWIFVLIFCSCSIDCDKLSAAADKVSNSSSLGKTIDNEPIKRTTADFKVKVDAAKSQVLSWSCGLLCDLRLGQ